MANKKSTPLNPFLVTGYFSPDYFCDREQETTKLISALQNGRNVTLMSPRRLGKTSLILHTFHRLQTQSDVRCYYVDLYKTDSLSSFVKQLANVILGSLDTTQEKIINQVTAFFKSLRPLFSLDSLSGVPTFSVDVIPELAEISLAEIFSYMEQSSKHCIVAFDEFQTIADYDDKNVEAVLRSYIQQLTSVQFIFSGSRRHVLESMFASANRPFYQSTQLMHLHEIPEQAYYQFAEEKMAAHNQQLPAEVFSYLYERLSGHTWYIQMLLNRMYESAVPLFSIDMVNQTINEILNENEATLQTFLRLITPVQAKLLKAIAQERTARKILGQTFIQKYHLGASSTVKSGIKSLVEKEMVLDNLGSYEVYDRFFGLWLTR